MNPKVIIITTCSRTNYTTKFSCPTLIAIPCDARCWISCLWYENRLIYFPDKMCSFSLLIHSHHLGSRRECAAEIQRELSGILPSGAVQCSVYIQQVRFVFIMLGGVRVCYILPSGAVQCSVFIQQVRFVFIMLGYGTGLLYVTQYNKRYTLSAKFILR